MTRQMEAILIIASDPRLKAILSPIIDQENEEIHWEKLNYGVLSGGIRTAVSWAFCIWTDGQVPRSAYDDNQTLPDPMCLENGWRDPFEGVGMMDRSLQVLVLKALAHRHEVFEEPSDIERYLRRLSPVLPD
jgi:hypothetical protein